MVDWSAPRVYIMTDQDKEECWHIPGERSKNRKDSNSARWSIWSDKGWG